MSNYTNAIVSPRMTECCHNCHHRFTLSYPSLCCYSFLRLRKQISCNWFLVGIVFVNSLRISHSLRMKFNLILHVRTNIPEHCLLAHFFLSILTSVDAWPWFLVVFDTVKSLLNPKFKVSRPLGQVIFICHENWLNDSYRERPIFFNSLLDV